MRSCPSHSVSFRRSFSEPIISTVGRPKQIARRCPSGSVGFWHELQLQPHYGFYTQADDGQRIGPLENVPTHARAMEHQGMPLSRELMYQLLQKSIEEKDLFAAREAHSLMASSPHSYVCVLDDRLIQLFALCSSLFEANLVFCLAAKPSCHTWHAILSAHTGLGFNEKALHLFGKMQCFGIRPSKVTLLCVLRTCGVVSDLIKAFLIHTLIIDSRFDSDVEVGNALLDAYAKCGSLIDGYRIFDNLKTKDVVSWNTLVAGYAMSEEYLLALYCFYDMQETEIEANNITFSCIFNVCGALEALLQGRLVHAQLLRSGIALDVVTRNALIDMYVKCQTLEDAYKIFEDFPDRDVVSWSAIIVGCAQHGKNSDALELFLKMQQGGLKPDTVAYSSVLNACSSLGALTQGMLVHAEIMRCGFESDVVSGGTLVDMYANCASLDDALKVFNGLERRNIVAWNAIIGSYVRQGQHTLALLFFEHMQQDSVQHDEVTARWILKACGSVRAPKEGHWIHDHALRAGFESNNLIESSLIGMYAKLGDLEGAKWVLDRTSNPTARWSTVTTGFASDKEHIDLSTTLANMREKSRIPDEVALSCMSKACATMKAVGEGKLVHDQSIRSGVDTDVVLGNSLISMYIEFGDLMAAEKVFHGLPIKDVVSWNSMIVGYSEHGFDFTAIELFEKLQQADLKLNDVTCLSVLKACSNVGAIRQGRLIHDLVIRSQVDSMMTGAVLVDMYATCGGLDCARKVLYAMPKRDVVTWGPLVYGYALYGCLDSCQQCVEAMQNEGVRPDDRIYHCILVACSQSGLVQEGLRHFKALQEVHGLSPGIEHCTCMTDLLCRAGCLLEAKEFFGAMPCLPNYFGWMSLFTACRLHGNKELARLCFDHAVGLDPHAAAGYLAMLNLMGDSQMWTEFHRIHDLWRYIGAEKRPGMAWIEVDNGVHEFAILRYSNPEEVNELLVKLDSLKRRMIQNGYSPQIYGTLEPFQNVSLHKEVGKESVEFHPFFEMYPYTALKLET